MNFIADEFNLSLVKYRFIFPKFTQPHFFAVVFILFIIVLLFFQQRLTAELLTTRKRPFTSVAISNVRKVANFTF